MTIKKRDNTWLMRTYSGHSSAKLSNELYRKNLSKGQTGLSVAFDLPTQTGYDSDHPLARGEVGKVGVPICNIDDMEILFNNIPLSKMNTSMTINATAAWLLALYVATAERQGVAASQLQGTTQNDILKEYLSRGTYIFPPEPSIKLSTDIITYTINNVPHWNPTNICSYHLQEAGATPIQELAYALSTAITILDVVRNSGQIEPLVFEKIVGRISFFVNAGIRFIEEMCKMRAFCTMWDKLVKERYGINNENMRRFRYGVQVNSLGLTEAQPENNVQRIVLEMLGVSLSKSARARAIQLPAWNEALGLPRPWDQQWALRMQQVLAFETDLLEYDDIFEGSVIINNKVQSLVDAAFGEMKLIENQGGMVKAIESGYVKRQLVTSHTARLRAIERGDLKIVGLNCYKETEDSPLTSDKDSGIMRINPNAELEQIEKLKSFRLKRNMRSVQEALNILADAARTGSNIMGPSILCAHSGVSTGEWASTLRNIFGEYRAPTGIDIPINDTHLSVKNEDIRTQVKNTGEILGRPLRILIGKPGLDGHSNGAEQIAVKSRDVGFEIIYEGIRLTPEQIAKTALEEGVHLIGLSVLSGSHIEMVEDIFLQLEKLGLGNIPVVIGGIIPELDANLLKSRGVSAVYTPKDIDMNVIMIDILNIIRARNNLQPVLL